MTQYAVHSILHDGKLRHAAFLALYVLNKGAQGGELGATTGAATQVELLSVFGAIEVLVESLKRAVRLVAKVTLVCGTIPRCGRCDVRNIVFAASSRKQTVCDEIGGVVALDERIDSPAVDAGHTGTTFQVQN